MAFRYHQSPSDAVRHRHDDIRIEHAKQIRELDLDGYAVGGLAVGETQGDVPHSGCDGAASPGR